MPKQVLVTGSNGFIGHHLCNRLREKGYVVRVLNRSRDISSPGSLELDLSSENWPTNPCENISVIFHLAGKAHALSETAKDINSYREVNTEGTRRLLCAAKEAHVDRFIFFSSVKAISDEVNQPIDETVTKAPDTPYGQSKLDAEKLVLQGGYIPLPVVLRPCMVYGKTHKGNLPRMIKAVRKGLFPPLPEVHNQRSMVHVEDLVTAAILAAESPNAPHNIYNVADANPYSTRQIYDWIRESAGKSPSSFCIPLPVFRAIAFAGDIISKISGRRFLFDSAAMQKLVGSSWYSSAKIENELGFKATYDLQQSLPAIVRFLDRS